MGILSMIQREKNKFKSHATEEEVRNARRGYIQGDVEVYEDKPRSIGGIISGAKQSFREGKTKLMMKADELRERKQERNAKENIRLQNEYENLRMKVKVNKQKIALEKSRPPNTLEKLNSRLSAIGTNRGTGAKRIPQSDRKRISKVRRVPPNKGNIFGGRDPFG